MKSVYNYITNYIYKVDETLDETLEETLEESFVKINETFTESLDNNISIIKWIPNNELFKAYNIACFNIENIPILYKKIEEYNKKKQNCKSKDHIRQINDNIEKTKKQIENAEYYTDNTIFIQFKNYINKAEQYLIDNNLDNILLSNDILNDELISMKLMSCDRETIKLLSKYFNI